MWFIYYFWQYYPSHPTRFPTFRKKVFKKLNYIYKLGSKFVYATIQINPSLSLFKSTHYTYTDKKEKLSSKHLW